MTGYENGGPGRRRGPPFLHLDPGRRWGRQICGGIPREEEGDAAGTIGPGRRRGLS